MCNRTDCAGSWAGPMACARCRERDMSEMKLTDADLARLEELAAAAGEGAYSAYSAEGDGCPTIQYVVAACNAAPALVAEVRRLRESLNKEHRSWQCADARGDWLEMENASLREKVEAWEWLVECIDNYEWNSNRSGWFVAQGVAKEAKATMQAAREAMK